MTSGTVAAIAGGAVVGVLGLLILAWRRAFRWAPLLWLLAAVGLSVGLGLHPFGEGRSRLWWAALLHPPGLSLLLLALMYSRLERHLAPAASPANAVLGGFFLGAWPTVAVLAPAAADPRQAARLALVASAAAAASPLGSPLPLLVADADPTYSAWAAVPAAVAIAVAWPRRSRPTGSGLPWPALAAGAAGIAACWIAGPLLGATVAAALTLLLVRGTPRQGPGPLGAGWLVTLAVSAHVVASAFHVSGLAHLVGRSMQELQEWAPSWAAYALGLCGVAAAVLADPFLVGAGLERADHTWFGLPADQRYLLTLGAALTPVPALLVARAHHGRGVLRAAFLPGLLQVAVVVGWIALTR